jgi:hypothetical protein
MSKSCHMLEQTRTDSKMPPRRPTCRFTIPGVDGMRASVGATANKLAGASGCSLSTTQLVLSEKPRTRNVCERVVNGLQTLGHKSVTHSDIKEVL